MNDDPNGIGSEPPSLPEPSPSTDVTLDDERPRIPQSWRTGDLPRQVPRHPWSAFWEETPEKHHLVRAEATDYVRRLSQQVQLHDRLRVLDFGCGTGYAAEQLAARVAEVALWDAAHSVRVRTAARLMNNPGIVFLDVNEISKPHISGSFDLVLAHSVIQYMTLEEFTGWLSTWSAMLAPGGSIILSDIIGDSRNAARELIDLLVFAARQRVLLSGLVEEATSIARYAEAHSARPLLTFTNRELIDLALSERLRTHFFPTNLGHKSGRAAAALIPISSDEVSP